MKLFLDDIRSPSDCVAYMHQRIGPLNPIYLEKWVTVKNFDQFVTVVLEHYDKITHVSFDHDLADEHYEFTQNADAWEDYHHHEGREMTGYDCARFLKDYAKEHHKKLPVMFVHSMNPVGTEKIVSLFK